MRVPVDQPTIGLNVHDQPGHNIITAQGLAEYLQELIMDVVVSWNLEHMVKLKTRIEANGINRLEGYHEIDISTPEEVI